MVKLFEGIIERRRARNAKEDDVLQVFMALMPSSPPFLQFPLPLPLP